MTFTDTFIEKPVLSVVVCLSIMVLGAWSILQLSVRQYPLSDNSSIVINTFYEGASEDLVSSFITVPIEQAVSATQGVSYMQSKSSRGHSLVTLYLIPNYDSTEVLTNVIAKLNRVRSLLPRNSEPPTVEIESIDSKNATTFLSFSSETYDRAEITDYITRLVIPRLQSLKGIEKTEMFAKKVFAMRVWLDPLRMHAYRISPRDVKMALNRNNIQSQIGKTEGGKSWVQLSSDSGLSTLGDFENVILREEGASIVRLKDVAKVELGTETNPMEAWISGKDSIFIGVWPASTANAISVIESVRREVDRINALLPKGISASVDYDSTLYIKAAINEVLITLLETFIIVIFVVFLFLGNARSALIATVTIPLSLIGASIFIYLFGFSFNLLTLLAIVLSVGIVVDDAIVVIENIERKIASGLSPVRASLEGTRELSGPVITMTITLAAVFLPIALQGGLTGSLFREFAVTLAGAIVVSGVIALVVSPVLSAHFLKPGATTGRPRVGHQVGTYVSSNYMKLLRLAMDHRKTTVFLWCLILALGIQMYRQSPVELAPLEDQGIIYGIFENPPNASQEYVSHFARIANRKMLDREETDYTFMVVGPHFGISGLIAKPWEERSSSVFDMLPGLGSSLSDITGLQVFPVLPPSLPGGGDFPIEFSLVSADTPYRILPFAQKLRALAAESGLFQFPPIIDTKVDVPLVEFKLNRVKLADLGLDPALLMEDLSVLASDDYVDHFNMNDKSYKVIPQLDRRYRDTAEDILNTYVSSGSGELIPLYSVVEIEEKTVSRSLNRMQQQNSVTLKGVPSGTLGDAIQFLEEKADDILPDGMYVDYGGETRQLKTEGNRLIYAFLLALVLIYLLLAIQFNSLLDPWVVFLGSLPMAMFGALVFTSADSWWLGSISLNVDLSTTLNIYSQIGLITLVGLITKNGILIVEFANKMQHAGMSKLDAVLSASQTRLRPIMMTSVATIAGHMPLIFVDGPGAEARNSIGIVLVGGMTIGSLLALVIVPVAYMMISKEKQRVDHSIWSACT